MTEYQHGIYERAGETAQRHDEEIKRLHTAIAKAHKYLQSATPRQRNGPCVQAVGVLQRAVSDLPHDNRCSWIIAGEPDGLEADNCTCGKIPQPQSLQDVMREASAIKKATGD